MNPHKKIACDFCGNQTPKIHFFGGSIDEGYEYLCRCGYGVIVFPKAQPTQEVKK